MAEGKKGSMKIPGKKVKGADYSDEEISFATQSDDDVCGFGLPVSLEAGQRMIKDFQTELLRALQEAASNNNEEAIEANSKHPIAITLGKEALLYIMTQKECEGIRFYFCKNHEKELSVVAVGVKNNPITDPATASLASKAKDLGSPDGKLSIADVKINSPQQVEEFFLFEVGPPTRLKDIISSGRFIQTPFEKELSLVFSAL